MYGNYIYQLINYRAVVSYTERSFTKIRSKSDLDLIFFESTICLPQVIVPILPSQLELHY